MRLGPNFRWGDVFAAAMLAAALALSVALYRERARVAREHEYNAASHLASVVDRARTRAVVRDVAGQLRALEAEIARAAAERAELRRQIVASESRLEGLQREHGRALGREEARGK